MKKLFIRSAVALAVSSLFTVTSSFASEQPNAADLVGKVYGGLHLTHVDLDSERWLTDNPLSSLNNANGLGIEFGYRASTTTEFRLAYSDLNLDSKNGGFDKPSSYGLAFDVLYFPTEKNFYLLGGVSQFDVVDTDLSSNLGLGYRHYVSEKAALYFETKAHYQFDNYYDDFTAQVGFTYFFGGSSSSSKNSNSDLAAMGFMGSAAYAGMSQAEKDLYASLTPAEQALFENMSATERSLFANLTPAERALYANMSVAERSLFLNMTPAERSVYGNMSQAEKDIYASLSPAERSLYLGMTQAQRDEYANMTQAEKDAFMAKLAAMALVDTDNDGVPDSADLCADSTPGIEVDARGCTVYASDVESITLSINFDNNKDVVKPEYLGKIEEVATFLKANTNVSVVIEGHASALGDAAVNQMLSQHRAEAVVAILTNTHGIDIDRLSAVGYGEDQLLNTANTAQAHAENRRIVAVMSTEK